MARRERGLKHDTQQVMRPMMLHIQTEHLLLPGPLPALGDGVVGLRGGEEMDVHSLAHRVEHPRQHDVADAPGGGAEDDDGRNPRAGGGWHPITRRD